MNLTEEQVRAVKNGESVRLDPDIGTECVILRADIFDRVKALLDDNVSFEQVGILVNDAMKEDDFNDPLLDSYQKYRT